MNEITKTDANEIMETVLLKGDLSKLTPSERNSYYNETCKSVGLNPLTRPFEYIMLQGKMVLYARKDATEQLRKIHGISVKIISQESSDGFYTVHVHAKDSLGREDEDVGVVVMPQSGAAEIRANIIMKAVTKAKRRVTLSICGLGFPDESEIEDLAREERKASRKVKTITSADKPQMIEQSSAAITKEIQTAAAAAPPPPSQKPQGGAADSVKFSDLFPGDILYQLDKGLSDAARRGADALQEEWKMIHPKYQKSLKQRLDDIYKPVAELVDAEGGK